MQHTVALETALVFLTAAWAAWWGGASIAYMVAMLFGVSALFCTIGSGFHGVAT